MARSAPQARGIDFETHVAEAVGGSTVPGSGSGWRNKSDVRSPLLLSAKATASRSWSQTRRDLSEAIDYALGTGLIPGLAVLDDDDSAFIVMRLEDLALALSGEVVLTPVKSAGEVRRDRASTPALLRDA
jgi:hypothetical protein